MNYGNSKSTVNIIHKKDKNFTSSVFRNTNELFYKYFEISLKYRKNKKFINETTQFLKNHLSDDDRALFGISVEIASAYSNNENKKRILIQLDFYPETDDNESLLKTLENIEYYFNNRNDVLGGYIITKEHAVAFTYCRNKIKYCNSWGNPCLDKKEISLELQKLNFDYVVVFLLLPKDYDIISKKWYEIYKS